MRQARARLESERGSREALHQIARQRVIVLTGRYAGAGVCERPASCHAVMPQ